MRPPSAWAELGVLTPPTEGLESSQRMPHTFLGDLNQTFFHPFPSFSLMFLLKYYLSSNRFSSNTLTNICRKFCHFHTLWAVRNGYPMPPGMHHPPFSRPTRPGHQLQPKCLQPQLHRLHLLHQLHQLRQRLHQWIESRTSANVLNRRVSGPCPGQFV